MGSPDQTISLLHATYHRHNGPLEIRSAWLDTADAPELVEYIVAIDDDDVGAVDATVGVRRIVGPASNEVTAVRNWNAAATLATGSLLVVIADDLHPRPGWDTCLRGLVAGLDPTRLSYAVKLSDSDLPGPKLLHPVVSRCFYERFGLFDARFTGVYCDDDLTATAFWHASIIDGTSVHLDHRHPTTNSSAPETASQAKVNATNEYDRGRQQYMKKWRWYRRAPLKRHGRMVAPGSGADALSNRWRAQRFALTYLDLAAWTLRRCRDYATSPRSALRRLRR